MIDIVGKVSDERKAKVIETLEASGVIKDKDMLFIGEDYYKLYRLIYEEN